MAQPLPDPDPDVKRRLERVENDELSEHLAREELLSGATPFPSKPGKLHCLTATEIRELICSDQVTVEEYARALIERYEARDVEVHAWAHYDKEYILAQARRLDALAAAERGPLHGVAVGIKDIFLTKDMPTAYYSSIHENDGNAAADSAAVSILGTAGALIMGKTHTTEFAATTEGGPCRNPRDIQHTPGGSSSGSAAAVSDFHVPIALGTQTIGSIVRPGSYTGTYAFKPTWGVISTEGVGRYAVSFDTVGFFARSVDDLDLLAEVFRLDLDFTTPRKKNFAIRGAKIALIKTHVWHDAQKDVQVAWEEARARLSQAGAELEDIDLPKSFSDCHHWHEVIAASEAKSAFLSKHRQSPELHDSLKAFVLNKAHSPSEILAAYDELARLRPQWDEIASRYDAVITPSTTGEAPRGLQYTGSSTFNAMWTALHAPCLNVPGFLGSLGLPVGLTVVGGRLRDIDVLAAGKAIGKVFAQRGG